MLSPILFYWMHLLPPISAWFNHSTNPFVVWFYLSFLFHGFSSQLLICHIHIFLIFLQLQLLFRYKIGFLEYFCNFFWFLLVCGILCFLQLLSASYLLPPYLSSSNTFSSDNHHLKFLLILSVPLYLTFLFYFIDFRFSLAQSYSSRIFLCLNYVFVITIFST